MPTTLLQALKLHEVSAVDSGANLLDGWLVQKRKERAEQQSAMAEAIRKTYGLNRDALGRFAAGDTPASAEAPAEAPKSRWNHGGAVHESLRAR
jgi:hypothetical protein